MAVIDAGHISTQFAAVVFSVGYGGPGALLFVLHGGGALVDMVATGELGNSSSAFAVGVVGSWSEHDGLGDHGGDERRGILAVRDRCGGLQGLRSLFDGTAELLQSRCWRPIFQGCRF